MPTNASVLVVVTALAVLALGSVLVWVTYKTRAPQRHATDTTIRDEVEENERRLRRQRVLADESAARVRAAEVEIEIRAIRSGRDEKVREYATPIADPLSGRPAG